MKEFKDILKLSADKIDKKDAVIAELKEVLKSLSTTHHRHEVVSNKQMVEMENERKCGQQSKLELEHRIEQLEYHNKDLTHKLSLTQSFLSEKTHEYEEKAKELNENRRVIKELEEEFMTMRAELEDVTGG